MNSNLGSYQNRGSRSYQQDRYLVDSKMLGNARLHLLAVADGMGGHRAGDKAAELAIAEIRTFFCDLETNDLGNIQMGLRDAFLKANASIRRYSDRHRESTGMGTTLTCAVIVDRKMVVEHVGDSRAYIINEDGIHRCTTDHSVYQEALDSGVDVSQINVGNHALTRCLDGRETIKPDNSIIYDVSQSLVALCSDGLHGTLIDEEIERLARNSPDAHMFARLAVIKALEHGGDDNVTVTSYACADRPIHRKGKGGPKRPTRKRTIAKRVLFGLLILSALSATVWGGYKYWETTGSVTELQDTGTAVQPETEVAEEAPPDST